MIRRRTLLAASASALCAPAIVERANAQSAFDWKQAKGTKLEVNLAKSPRADVLQSHQKEFEELTGIKVGSEQIPEQQQRPKVAMEMSSGHPSFDVVNVAMHVQKRLIEKGRWMEDLRPLIADKGLTNPDLDMADFSETTIKIATGPDGKLNVLPMNQDLFILFWNKELFQQAGIQGPPKTFDEMMAAAQKLTDKGKGVYGFTGRGLKNANVVVYDNILLGWDQETITPDGKTLLTDTPAAIEAAQWYQKIMRECAPPGSVGFNWNECQTTFGQGRAAMWWDGIGFSAPLVDPTKSKIVGKVGFAPVPAGPKAQHSATFVDGIGIPAGAKNKTGAWLYLQWSMSKTMLPNWLRQGAGTPPRASSYKIEDVIKTSPFPQDWFDTTLASLKLARSGLPEIVPVTEFRDTIGVALTNIVGGADPATELKKATEAFKPVLAKANES
ncbi:MAG TPA: sugar ABC transporter substrate-binding protein [Acetobacteraceae bacterium]|nr:sugar ABC transporter substrate-binding protein [Acetobacteraceae bacterium]